MKAQPVTLPNGTEAVGRPSPLGLREMNELRRVRGRPGQGDCMLEAISPQRGGQRSQLASLKANGRKQLAAFGSGI